MKLKVGDEVLILDRGRQYSSYNTWVEFHAPTYRDRFRKFNTGDNGDIGIIVSTGKHLLFNEDLVLVDLGYTLCLINVEGVELLKTKIKYTLDEVIRIMLDDKTVKFSKVGEKKQCYVQRKGDHIVWLGENQRGQTLELGGIDDEWELYGEEYSITFMELCKIIQDSDCTIKVRVEHMEYTDSDFDYFDDYISEMSQSLYPTDLAEVFTTGKWYYREEC